jgi:hypothetical protein
MARAQQLPTQPVRIIVGFAPGGGTDILARVIGQKLADMWRTTVIVENKAGASGTIAADYVAKQPGDGTVLHMAHINSHAIVPNLQKAGLRRREGLPADRHGGRHAQPADLRPDAAGQDGQGPGRAVQGATRAA